MSAETRTAAEVRALREAWLRGVAYNYNGSCAWPPHGLSMAVYERYEKKATELYPAPMVTVPRVLSEGNGGVSYKIDKRSDGLTVLFVRCDDFTGGRWQQIQDAPHSLDVSRLTLIASLLANPTEQQEAP